LDALHECIEQLETRLESVDEYMRKTGFKEDVLDALHGNGASTRELGDVSEDIAYVDNMLRMIRRKGKSISRATEDEIGCVPKAAPDVANGDFFEGLPPRNA